MSEGAMEGSLKRLNLSEEVVLQDNTCPNTELISFGKTIGDAEIITRTEKEIGYPCFIRPNNTDSSIGSSRVRNVHELRQGILKAFRSGDEIIIEKENTV